MSFWRNCMPTGMKLRSPWAATHIADPNSRFTLDRFMHALSIPPEERYLLMPVERFVHYGEWFAHQTVPHLDKRNVVRVDVIGRGYCLVLADGGTVRAPRVVFATGLANQDYWPVVFHGQPSDLISHSSRHASLYGFRGRRVAVVGRGQSACESAALLRESGAEVELICRGDIRWSRLADEQAGASRRRSPRLREKLAPAAVGPFPLNWLNEKPGLMHRMPGLVRALIEGRSLRAVPAPWMMPRLVGVKVHAGGKITNVQPKGRQIVLRLDERALAYDHILLATGYRCDVAKLGLLPSDLLRAIATRNGCPVLSEGFESSIARLHFVGPWSSASFGPLMRFIAGAGYTARSVTQAVLAQRTKAAPESRAPLPGQLGSSGNVSRA
jgi:cation diffusion facilitator CzcD-associated flavoprotein CzcO